MIRNEPSIKAFHRDLLFFLSVIYSMINLRREMMCDKVGFFNVTRMNIKSLIILFPRLRRIEYGTRSFNEPYFAFKRKGDENVRNQTNVA
jgi:hypothetical protein